MEAELTSPSPEEKVRETPVAHSRWFPTMTEEIHAWTPQPSNKDCSDVSILSKVKATSLACWCYLLLSPWLPSSVQHPACWDLQGAQAWLDSLQALHLPELPASSAVRGEFLTQSTLFCLQCLPTAPCTKLYSLYLWLHTISHSYPLCCLRSSHRDLHSDFCSSITLSLLPESGMCSLPPPLLSLSPPISHPSPQYTASPLH